MAGRRPNIVFVMADDHTGLLAELAELRRLSDEVGDVAPAEDQRRRATAVGDAS
jgi:hypothetical protein